MEFQGQEVLSLQDTLRCSTREPWENQVTSWQETPSYAWLPTDTHTRARICFVHKWHVSEETRIAKYRLLRPFSTRKATSKSGIRKDNFTRLRSSAMSTFKCLIKDTLLWRGVMSTNLNNPKDQADRKKGTLSNQPWLIRVTSTALLGSLVRQPIKDMTSLGTDFEMHAYWQGYAEEPAVKDVIARKSHTNA